MIKNIRNSFLNKTPLYDFIDGSFWFGKDENKAEVKNYKNRNQESEINISFVDMGKEKDNKNLVQEILETKEVVKVLDNPTGYIELYMHKITPNELFVNHRITMQYLTINGNKFIKELRLDNQGRELDCYSEGENKSLTIEKISSTQALLTLEELNGNLEKFIIINGAII